MQEDDASGEAILEVFSKMGVQITRAGSTITAQSYGPLQGINLDGNNIIDSAPVIVAAACFANSPSRIYNIANLQLKESNRIADLATELSKLGCQIKTSTDAFEISAIGAEGIHGGVQVEAHSDHRLIEALAAVGLGSRHPITISNAQHVAKSYPHFFADLATLGAKIE